MSFLHSQKILVAGAAGAVGEGVSLAMARAKATVIAVDRDAGGLQRLEEKCADSGEFSLHAVSCDLSSTAELDSLNRTIESKWGRIDGVVVSLGGWWDRGRLSEVDVLGEWREVASKTLHPQLALVRRLVPRLREAPDGRYLFIGGSTAERPQPRAGLTSVAAAAQLMVARVLQDEEPEISTAALLLSGPVRSYKLSSGDSHWMDSSGVGEVCVHWFQPGGFPRGEVLRAANRDELTRLTGRRRGGRS